MSMKKWVTKKEISDLLKAYSVRPDEFESFGDDGYSFKSRYAKGYVISFEPEIQHENVKTGRIILSHTKWDGKRTFQDIWGRDSNGKLQFFFRNPWNKPFADYDYIHDLETENKELKETGQKVITNQNIQKMFNERSQLLDRLSDLVKQTNEKIALLELENEALREKSAFLEKQNQKLINETEHNARGAGRKADPQHLKEQVAKVQSLIEEGKSISEIQQIMGISRSSYFRYKKFIENT